MAFEYLVPQTLTDTGGLLISNAVGNIDETIESLDTAYNTTGTDDQTAVAAASWALTNIASFTSVVGATFRVNASGLSIGNDTWTYRFRLNVGGSTYDINFTQADGSYTTKTIAVGTGFSEAQYNAATVELVQTAHSKSAGPDGYFLSINAIDLAIEFSNDVNVTSDYDTLTITTYESIVNGDVEIISDFDSLSITTYTSTVNNRKEITSDFETITLTEYDALLNVKKEVTSDFDSLSITTYTSTVNNRKEITSDYNTLTITSYLSSARIGVNVKSDFKTITLTEYDALLNVKKEVTSDFETITLTDYDSTIKLNVHVVSDFDTLPLTSYPTSLNVKKEITSDFETFTLTGYTSIMTGNFKKSIVSDYTILNLTTYQSTAALIIPGIFEISGQMIFKGNWTVNET